VSLKRWKSALGVLLVFVLGLISGTALTTFVHLRAFSRPGLPDRVAAIATRGLTRELELNEAQQKVVREAMEESRRELGALREEMGPRMDAVFEKARERIRACLNEDQKKRLDEMARDRHSLMRRLFGGPRFGPGRERPPWGGRGGHRPPKPD